MAGPPRSLLRQNSSSGAFLGSASDSRSSCSGSGDSRSGAPVRSTTVAAAVESASGVPVRSITAAAAVDSASCALWRMSSSPVGSSRCDGRTANVRYLRLGGGLPGHCGLHSGLISLWFSNAGRSINDGGVVKADLFGEGVPRITMTLERVNLLKVAIGKLFPASGDHRRKWCLITLVTGVLASSGATPNAC